MRTGNLRSLSARDWAGIKERREFEQAELEKQRLAEDQAEYQKYVQSIENEQQRVPPARRIAPLSFDEWRVFMPQEENDPVLRGQLATNRALTARVRETERETVIAGKRDPGWQMPADCAALKMSVEQAREYAKAQAELFVSQNPEYHRSKKNFETITRYLVDQGINIPTSEVFRLAWERLRSLGLIEERPAPEPIPSQQTQQAVPPREAEATEPQEDLVDGFDPETGEPRKFTQQEVWRMPSDKFKKAFRVWGNNAARFTRGYFG